MVNDNVYYVLVEKLDAAHDSVTAIKTSGSVLELAEGQIAIINSQSVCVGTTADGSEYRIARMINGKIEMTPEFLPENVLSENASSYAADTNKIETIGFNGVSGEFVVADSTAYTLNLLVRDTQPTFGNKEMYKFGTYKTGISATGLEACIGLTGNLIKNFSREPEKLVGFEVLSGDAGAALTSTDDVAVVNGLDTVTMTAGDLVVGDYLRTGVAVTNNVYKVIAIPTTTTAKLDRLVTEATGDITCETVTASDTAGIKFSGIDKTRFEAGLWKFEPADFKIMPISDVAGVTTQQTAYKGLGTWQTVAEDEWFAQGNRGYGNRTDGMIPYSGPKMGVEKDRNYDAFTFKFKDQRFTNLVGQSPASIISVTVYGSTETITALDGDIA
jgi:hypothetical protein